MDTPTDMSPDKPRIFAALLTTGPSPAEDRVVEAAALRGPGDQSFRELARPEEITKASLRLCGLSETDLAGCPPPARVLEDLAEFCGRGPVVVHDAGAFGAFFEVAGVRPPALLDARDLARIAAPRAAEFSLEGLADELEIEQPQTFRAADRARLLADIWEALLQKLADTPPAALDQICRLAQAAGHPLADVLTGMADSGGFELSVDAVGKLAELFPNHRELFRKVQKYKPPEPGNEPLPADQICAMFGPDAVIGRNLSGYEQRDEQVWMVRAVCEALSEPHHLMVEAGTGTGKSMGYLLPAIAWTCINNDKVVISTNTRNLQEQLYHKDLPFLSELLPGRFEPALLKGRSNYICVRRFMHLMQHFERELAEPEHYMALAPLVKWSALTVRGDISECNGFLQSPGASAVRHAVVSGSDQCAGRACRYRTHCMVQRARCKAQLADVIVVNHALLFSEIGLDTPVLPEYRCVVFDEAHKLEEVATNALAEEGNSLSVYRVTNWLYRSRQDGSGSGLLSTLMHELGSDAVPAGKREGLKASAGNVMDLVDDVVQATRQFFEVLREPFQELPPYMERIMLAECEPPVGRHSEAWEAADRLRKSIAALGVGSEDLAESLEPLGEESDAIEEVARDLRSAMERLREVGDTIEFILLQENEEYVYWLERVRRQRREFCSIHAAPLQIGDHFRDFLFGQKRTVIFTSATLQVAGEFDYMLERMGADVLPPGHIHCLSVGSPFDYSRQSLVGVTTFLPDPGGRRDRDFDRQLGEFLRDLLRATEGRAMVLFTSYSLLEAVYGAVKEPLERAGIKVLAQGHSGSREAITTYFRHDPASVLLGTRSFWEGVDIAGQTLSCLVLTKLPFHVFTDPLVRGRMSYLRTMGRDPFRHYTLPQAVISFRQGFGRLIRRKTDRGVVIVTDRRMVTKDYGKLFLDGLPTGHEVFQESEQALNAVREFFHGPD